MKQHSSLKTNFKKQKELISEDGKVKFNNQKNQINAKGKKNSSQKWLRRQINDPYANAAKIEGYLARSAYKLLEIQKKYRVIEPKHKVIIDLGCSPGSWSQVILTNKQFKGKKVIGVDLLEVKFKHKDLHFIQGDIEENGTQKQLIKTIQEITKSKTKKDAKVDCIICDIALNNIGDAEVDRMRSERIIELALNFCKQHLVEGGNFVCKSLKGADNEVFEELKKTFRFVYRFKPNSSRKDSSEMFLVCLNKR